MRQPACQRLALTVGDPFGIGPELVTRVIAALPADARQRVTIFGSARQLHRIGWRQNDPVRLGFDAAWESAWNEIEVVDHDDPGEPVTPGPSAEGGRASLAYLASALAAIKSGRAGALVTGPISKESWKLSGALWTGQTEYLADACGLKPTQVEMLFLGEAFHLVLATRHLPLRDVASEITPERVAQVILAGARALKSAGMKCPRVSVLALNPHASDGGLIGHEENAVIRPGMEKARARLLSEFGAALDGPHPADGFFAAGGPTDKRLVVAFYHDQGLIPFKMKHPRSGINYTFGLPFVRFSPDHGTAFDLAGTGRADPASLKHAVDQLLKL